MRVTWVVLGAALALASSTLVLAEEPAAPAAKPMGEKEKAEAQVLLRNYLLDEHEDRTQYRLDLKKWLDAKSKAGIEPLGDIPGLTEVIYKSRPFATPFEKKHLPRETVFSRDEVNKITSVDAGGGERFSFSLPPKYPADPKALAKVPPYPTILSLHELVDFQEGATSKQFPGLETIKRRYPRSGALKPITEDWLVFAPVSTKAQFGAEFGKRIVTPFSRFWKSYHVDFDRVVLDGGDDVLAVAVSIPVFFHGIIVRGDPRDLDPKLAVNIAGLPVYVVGGDDAPAARWLKAAGLSPKVGPADGVLEWLKDVRTKPRKLPTEFKWHVKAPDQQILAYWLNLNQVAPDSDLEVKASRVDNTVTIKATGVEDLTVFLNDLLVDLSKPVRIVINEKEAVPTQVRPRNLDQMFESGRIRIRNSGYYGWLFATLLERVKVPPPPAPAATPKETTGEKPGAGEGVAPPTSTDSTSPEEREAEAGRYFQKGEEAEKAGLLDKALSLFQKAFNVGESSFRARAEAKLKELKAKIEAAPSKPGAAAK